MACSLNDRSCMCGEDCGSGSLGPLTRTVSKYSRRTPNTHLGISEAEEHLRRRQYHFPSK